MQPRNHRNLYGKDQGSVHKREALLLYLPEGVAEGKMRILIFGKQASGKGTQAKLISEKYKIQHIATGDIFRNIRKEDSELGKKVRALIDGGKLVPDDVTTEIVMREIKKAGKGFILDGYPRNLAQVHAFVKVPVDIALLIEISDAEAIKRMSARRICIKCGEIYNVLTKKPKQEGKCDKCSGEVVQRDDDKPASIKERLATYKKETAPIMDFYKKKGLLKEVDGTRPIEGIFREICRILDGIKTS